MARKKRVMSPEQREAAIKRLAAAREKRMRENPPQYKNISDEVLALPDDHALNMKNVKEWIKSNKTKLSVLKKQARQGMKGADAKAEAVGGYIRNMQNYLESGIWNDMFFGENAENPIQFAVLKTSHLAYDADGFVKRNVGTWYCDIGTVWTKEMAHEAR